MAKTKRQVCWCGGVLTRGQKQCSFCQKTSESPGKFEQMAVLCQFSSSKEPWVQATMCCVCQIRRKCQKRLDYLAKKQSQDEKEGGRYDRTKRAGVASV